MTRTTSDMIDSLQKMKVRTSLYSLQVGRFVVKKFSRAAGDAVSGSGVQFFTRRFKLRTFFETAEFCGCKHLRWNEIN